MDFIVRDGIIRKSLVEIPRAGCAFTSGSGFVTSAKRGGILIGHVINVPIAAAKTADMTIRTRIRSPLKTPEFDFWGQHTGCAPVGDLKYRQCDAEFLQQ